MKALIISDSHGDCDSLKQVLKRVGKVDMVIHLGDICGDEKYLCKNAGCDVCMIAGNNDFYTELKKEEILILGKNKLFLTHGHRYYVNYGIERILEEACSIGMDVILFGHTHVPLIKQENGVFLVNPGSIAYPRQANRKRSFVIMEIDKEENLHFSLDYLD